MSSDCPRCLCCTEWFHCPGSSSQQVSLGWLYAHDLPTSLLSFQKSIRCSVLSDRYGPATHTPPSGVRIAVDILQWKPILSPKGILGLKQWSQETVEGKYGGPASDNCHCPGWPTRSWCKTLLLKTAQTLIRGVCGINNLEASSLLASSQSTGRCYAGCSEKKVINSLAQGPAIIRYNLGVSYYNDQRRKIWPSVQQRHKC